MKSTEDKTLRLVMSGTWYDLGGGSIATRGPAGAGVYKYMLLCNDWKSMKMKLFTENIFLA